MATITLDWRNPRAWWTTVTRKELHNLMAVAMDHGFTIRVAGQHWDR